MDDIWSSYYLEACGFNVVYTKATVFQDRNVQDLTKNLKEEFDEESISFNDKEQKRIEEENL